MRIKIHPIIQKSGAPVISFDQEQLNFNITWPHTVHVVSIFKKLFIKSNTRGYLKAIL